MNASRAGAGNGGKMPLLERHSLERRAIDFLQEHYPVTARELAAALGVPEKRMLAELRLMRSRGLVELDVLPDEVFVRCLVVAAPRRKSKEGGGGKKGSVTGREKEKKGGDDPAYI